MELNTVQHTLFHEHRVTSEGVISVAAIVKSK